MKDVRPYIHDCDVVTLPSYREGTGRVLLEGLAMGKPLITTDTAGCRDTVEHGKNGFLVPIQDAKALAQAMLDAAAAKANGTLLKMGKYSREKAEKEFDQAFVAREDARRSAECGLQLIRLRRVRDRNGCGAMLAGLFEEQLGVAARRQAEQADVAG